MTPPGHSPSQAELAYGQLETLLVTLRLMPGEVLQEKSLMEVTGLGRTPVREAVQRLSAQGLLRVMPRKGLMVQPVSRHELVRVLEVRRVLERLLVVKAAERAAADQRQALSALASHLPATAGDLDAFLRLDRRLDELLAEACDNDRLVASLAPLHVHCRRLWYLGLQGQGGSASGGSSADLAGDTSAAVLHAGLAQAVSEGDSAGAIRALNGIMGTLEALVADLDHLN